MALESPSTYAEWYWKHSIDAQKEFADAGEKAIAPYMAALLADIPLIDEMPSGVKNFISTLSTPTSFQFLPYLIGVGVNTIDEVLDAMFDPMIAIIKRANNRRTKEKWLTSERVNTLWTRKKITEGLWNETTASEGYEESLAEALYESQLPYPTIPDIISYARYHGDYDNAWSVFQEWYNISPREWPVWEWLTLQKLTTEHCQTLLKRGAMSESEFYAEIGRLGWPAVDRNNVKELAYMLPNAMLLVQGALMQEAATESIIESISKADIHPNYAQLYLDGVLTKPATTDIIAYELRKDPSLSNLDGELRRTGIHPNYYSLYKELAYQIPPVADIITMAVRETFTPEIAARFGQYEGLPTEFVKWVGKKGLSQEWAERYWAAHWSLPSPQQGFEMLHRGVISRSDLELLLRALDIMPFWRDKLIQISYNPLTRVDVRRMYNLDIINTAEVKQAYKDIGYSDENATRLTAFTVKIREAAEAKAEAAKAKAEAKAEAAKAKTESL